MRPDRQLVRLMVAMIVMIIAYVAPSAVQAHEGHHHGGHDHAAMTHVAKAPAATPASRDVAPAAGVTNVAPLPLMAAEPARIAVLQSGDAGRGCCPGPCKGDCCGTMACCASGILSAPAALPTLAFGQVVLISHDVDGRPGVGPEALPRPPRTLA